VRQLGLEARVHSALGALPEDLARGPVGLAVSGGSDSIALLHLAARWRPEGLRVFTVDHRLRTASAAEAETVAALCRKLGLAHETLVWTSPSSGQPAARRARHALLASALKAAGGQLLLTGHSATDQAETVLMRVRQGSGWYGLAAMRALSLSPVWPQGAGVWIARPLLGETRGALRGWLGGQGAEWVDDPSNANPAFERVRVRARLAASGDALTARILRCQQGAARLRAIEDARLAAWLGARVEILGSGGVRLSLAGLAPETAARALGVLLQCVGGRETPPRSAALAALVARIEGGPAFRGATLGGVRLRPVRGGTALFPETGGQPGSPDSALLTARVSAFRRLFINSAQEIDAGSGKESFLQGMEPIF
jgi:tRNA(Ile)-lysidine synthase